MVKVIYKMRRIVPEFALRRHTLRNKVRGMAIAPLH
jgi:hypothetical protein